MSIWLALPIAAAYAWWFSREVGDWLEKKAESMSWIDIMEDE